MIAVMIEYPLGLQRFGVCRLAVLAHCTPSAGGTRLYSDHVPTISGRASNDGRRWMLRVTEGNELS